MNVVIETTFFKLLTLVSLGKLFADLLGNTTKAALCMSGGFHQSMLSW
jgi:hypothetical protein